MGWTGLAVYSGAYQTGVDGRTLENNGTFWGMRMVLNPVGDRSSESENEPGKEELPLWRRWRSEH